MEKDFYFIDDLNVYIRLSRIVSFTCKGPFESSPKEHFRCCIVISDETVYWCNKRHFIELKKVFEL